MIPSCCHCRSVLKPFHRQALCQPEAEVERRYFGNGRWQAALEVNYMTTRHLEAIEQSHAVLLGAIEVHTVRVRQADPVSRCLQIFLV